MMRGRLATAVATLVGAFVTMIAPQVMAQASGHVLLGVNCDTPPVWHCPDTECQASVVTQEGTVVDLKSRRPFFLDCPAGYNCNHIGPGLHPDTGGKCVQFCGGFAGIACHDPNKACVDNPNDSCDPAHGGADCGGICQ